MAGGQGWDALLERAGLSSWSLAAAAAAAAAMGMTTELSSWLMRFQIESYYKIRR